MSQGFGKYESEWREGAKNIREWGPKQGLNGHHRDVDTVASINFWEETK